MSCFAKNSIFLILLTNPEKKVDYFLEMWLTFPVW